MTIRTAHHLDLMPEDTGGWTPESQYADVKPASAESVATILAASTDGMDGRSNWLWFRMPNGDLIFGCYPEGDTYFDCEIDHSSPASAP